MRLEKRQDGLRRPEKRQNAIDGGVEVAVPSKSAAASRPLLLPWPSCFGSAGDLKTLARLTILDRPTPLFGKLWRAGWVARFATSVENQSTHCNH
ncbi:hypothetical protein PIB30_059283 [Stylosanthes scabra]|uniref:Uncharacterized protein n=1 Tax=Stylosanthes scabra TaxID=79078 RepID=A0ABU6RKK2_9FABA|nr:hypothetical protein [Stylosanthes scabra]